jgi:hypothetical protein
MEGFSVKTGSIIGRVHSQHQANCQDKFALTNEKINDQNYLIGVVADGCGSGKHSEIGAGLLANFLVREAARQLAKGTELNEIPNRLYPTAVCYLKRVLAGMQPGDPANLGQTVADYFLATALGFVIGQEKGIIFTAGDGLLALNETVNVLDKQNYPNYLGYHLLPGAETPMVFEVTEFEVADLERLAIWTDGLCPELLPQTWGHSYPRGLQRQLNLLSRSGSLADDATGIVIEKC